MSLGFRIKLEFKNFVFVDGGKSKNPEKTLGARTRTNKLNPLVMTSAGFLVANERCFIYCNFSKVSNRLG